MVNAFSFCLFGETSNLYHRGFLENLDLIKRYYPGWVVYAYLGSDTESGFKNYLSRDPVVRVRDTGITGFRNTVYRFFAIDEPDVEVCFFRDADSRVHWKDRWAINGFMSLPHGCHIIRDHKEHTAMIAAGMWGLRQGVLKTSMRGLFESWTPIFAGNGDPSDIEGFGIDQNFLVKAVYNRISSTAFVHSSNGKRNAWENGAEFPFAWTNDIYCGRREFPPFAETVPDTPLPRRTPAFIKLSYP
jgi:hypothetical protein